MDGETAVITGASRGIGRAIAKRFADAGVHVVICSRNTDDIEAVATEIREADGDVTAMRADVRDEFDVERLMEQAARVGGNVEYVVANAGVYHGSAGETPLTSESYAAFDDHMRSNARGVFTTVREALPHLAENARILVSSGRVARDHAGGYGSYAVSKAAAEALVRGFSADTEYVTTVVDPGIVETELTGKSGHDPNDVAEQFHWVACEASEETVDGEIVDRKQWRRASR